jgi:hypothetical protein
VTALTLLEASQDDEGRILRSLVYRMNEAAKHRYAGREAKSALSKAEAGLKTEAQLYELIKAKCALELEEWKRRRDSVVGSVGPADRSPRNPRVWALLSEIKRLRETHDRRVVSNRILPGWLLVQLREARTAGVAQLEAFRETLEDFRLRRRENTNPAFELDLMIWTWEWSASTAARLWVRVTVGPDEARERQFAQAVDAAWRARLQPVKARWR